MLFHQRHQRAQHRGGYRLGRFIDLDHLEASGQSGVFFKVLFVLGPRGRRQGAQFPTRQCRFEQVGSIILPGRAPCTDQRVGFVDKQNDGNRVFLDLFNHVFKAQFKLTFDAGPGLQQPHVQRQQFNTQQRTGHIADGDGVRQAFGHRRFAHTGFTGKDRVVLPAAHEDVDHLANFHLAANNRVQVSVAGALGQAGGELIQRRCFHPYSRPLTGLCLRRSIANMILLLRAFGEPVKMPPKVFNRQLRQHR